MDVTTFTSGFDRCVSTASIGSFICSTLHPYATGVNLIIVCNGTSRYGSSSEMKTFKKNHQIYKNNNKKTLKITIFCYCFKCAYIIYTFFFLACYLFYFFFFNENEMSHYIRKQNEKLLNRHHRSDGMAKLKCMKTCCFFHATL